MVDTNIEFRTPLLLAPDALEDYGRGRKCVHCKTNKVNRYQSQPVCFTCQSNKIDKELAAHRREAEIKGKLANLNTKLYNLKTHRLKLGLSQRELARRVDTNPAYITQLEHRRNGCGDILSRRLARALGVTVTELRGTNGEA